MGLKKKEVDSYGNSHEAAYLKIADINYDNQRYICRYSLLVFKDKFARDESLQPFQRYHRMLAKQPGVPVAEGVKELEALNKDWDTYCSIKVLDAKGMNLVKSLYGHAKASFPDGEVTDVLEK